LSAFCRKTVSPKSALRWRRIWHAISRAVTILKAAKTNRVYALLAKSPVFAGLVAHPLAMALADKRLRKDRSRRGFSAVESAATHRPWKSAVSNMGDGVLVYFGYPQAHEDDAGLTAGWAALKDACSAPNNWPSWRRVASAIKRLPGIARPSGRVARVLRLPDDLICSTIAKNAVVCRVSHCPSRL
jgi:hypothetical protein